MSRDITISTTVGDAHYRYAELRAASLGMDAHDYLAGLMVCTLDDELFEAEQEFAS